ncbi:metallophosphoesterase [Paenibacillus sp. NPDC056579]|uniref:metallophosphoesterase family protein n=1 Tax=Paenibacillus sp. NPDC056579 TaxID=3345871 RepID=UPI0036B635D7
MLIAFIGDIHGRVFHTLALIETRQRRSGRKLDLVIQVGDLGAYPEPTESLLNEKYVQLDAAELDFSRLVKEEADGKLADDLRYLRRHHVGPILFIRGNHEDFDWLDSQSCDIDQGTVPVDSFDLFHYVKDGTVLNYDGTRIAFLGGIETPKPKRKSIDPAAYERLLQCKPGEIDILITHDAPYGIGRSFHGQTQGSALLSKLIETIEPNYLIAGHYHHVIGPKACGRTTYLGLNVLVDLRDDGERRRVQPGSMAVLDTATKELQVVQDDWFAQLDKHFDFPIFMERLKQRDHRDRTRTE